MNADLPAKIDEPNVWTGANLNQEKEWLIQLSADDVAEIDIAVDIIINNGTRPHDIRPDDFLLPSLSGKLKEAYDTIENGRGFLVLRGWPSERHSYARNIAAFCGVASHFGEAKVQNYEGEAIVDVIDEAKPYDHTSRGYMSNKRLPFHSDGADIVGLLCLGEPSEGGRSLLVSATHLYNTVQMERPDALPMLLRGFRHHRRGQHDPGEPPVTPEHIPIFSFHDGLLHCCYNRNPIEWVAHEGIELTVAEVELLDYFDSLCHRPDMAIEMIFRRGDMQFVNNFVILHSRSEYRDGTDAKRHLVRLWLEDRQSRRAAAGLLDIYVPGSSKVSGKEATE